MAVSKRLRYEILRRDNHTCRYCGAKAPEMEITVDHVTPQALGGTDGPSNLVAACRDCNSGKTSSSPDAPLVADVADDAVRWSAAMRRVQADALVELKARQADRRQFAEWWDVWTYESDGKRHTVPRPGDWEQTVDQLVSAGLPLPLLKDCIDRAMGRTKVLNEDKFRYMCGVAWKKLTELQEAARSAASAALITEDQDQGGEEDEDPAIVHGRADLASELLGDLSEEERQRLFAEAREDWQAETEDEQHIAAAHIAWREARLGLSWLAFSVCDLLAVIPDDAVADAQHQARVELYDEEGPGFTRAMFAERAIQRATAIYREKADRAYLASLPEGEADEWVAYANAVLGKKGALAGRWEAFHAAACAHWVKETGLPYDNMCLARGEHIERCPAMATHYLQFAEYDCCRDAGEDHDRHIFCDRHAQMAAAGELRRDGEPVTVTLKLPFTPAKADEAVAF